MWFEDDFVGGEREERRRRVRLVCRCREVREWDDCHHHHERERERFICRCREING